MHREGREGDRRLLLVCFVVIFATASIPVHPVLLSYSAYTVNEQPTSEVNV